MRQQKQTLTFRSAAEMLDVFGMQQRGSQYRIPITAFQRIFGATIFFGPDMQAENAAVTHHARFNFMREARIWYSRHPNQALSAGGFENVIVLSDEFFREVTTHSIPTTWKRLRHCRSRRLHWTCLCGFRIADSRPVASY